MNEQRPPKKNRFGLREAAVAGLVTVGVAGALNSEKSQTPAGEAREKDTASDSAETGEVVSETGHGRASRERMKPLAQERDEAQQRDAVAVELLRNLPEGFKAEPKGETIWITTDKQKFIGEVYVDPENGDLTFQPPDWATSNLDSLGEFQIDQYTFRNPAEIAEVTTDMNTIGGWVDDFNEFKEAATQDFFNVVGSKKSFEADKAASMAAIDAEQTVLVKKVQDESAQLHLIKIH